MIFITTDTTMPTYIWSKTVPGTHKIYHMKTADNQVWTETTYNGDATFGGKNYFALVAELNATKTMLAKSDPVELGQRIYNGSLKLISRKGGIVCPREIQWPEIVEDDERKWNNRKPVLSEWNVVPPMNVKCDCDYC